MTKLNNKGVSLIDCLIAVAVLALLVSPIIAQLFSTIQVSAEAKEKQYVIDKATEVYEFFRKYDNKELADTSKIKEEGFSYTINPTNGTGTTKCKLYDQNGDPVTVSKNGTSFSEVEYSWTRYDLVTDTGIGREQSDYTRTVVRTDLRNKLYELGLQVDYSISAGSTLPDKLKNVKLADVPTNSFVSRSDNSIVYPDTGHNMYEDNHIRAIVVKKIPDLEATYIDELLNPNDIDIGNVQDIDSDKIAIISGDATAIDYQLDHSLQNVLVQYATANPTSAIGTYADNPEKLNNYIKSVINNPASTSKLRKIKVSVTCGKDSLGANALDSSNKPKYYNVKCDVTYRVTFSGNDLKAFNNFSSTTGEFTYTVLDRNYYTNTPPDIYMIYEPLLLSTSTNNYSFYADNDYITIHTDEFTSAVENNPVAGGPKVTRGGDDPSRLYLIKPENTWAVKTNVQTATDLDVSNFDDTTYYTYRNGKFYPVNIFINMEKETTSKYAPIDVYTNISKKTIHPDAKDDDKIGQFVSDTPEDKIGGKDINNYPYPTIPPSADGRENYPNIQIIRVDKEQGIEKIDRLGQITVTYQKLDNSNNPVGEVTYITGAKGAD